MERFLNALEQRLPVIHGLLTVHMAKTALFVGLLMLAVQWGSYVVVIAQAENYITSFGPVVGGDFVVFYEAAQASAAARADLYTFENLNAALSARFPDHEKEFMLGWQYPPTMFLLIGGLTGLPYLAAFAAWTGLTFLAFGALVHRLWPNKTALILAVSSPVAFWSVVTGQTGFLTALLLAGAALLADKRPLLAGLCAGLLTVKPQLGLLLPIAYIAAGSWRAFFAAAVTSLSLAALSVAIYGVDLWVAFFEAVTVHSGRMGTDGFPFQKLASVYGGLSMVGVPSAIALTAQALVTLGLGALVAFIWRRTKEDDLRFAVLGGAALLASPYAFNYELPMVILAVTLIARRGVRSGWMPYEPALICFLYFSAFVTPGEPAPHFPISFAVMIVAFLTIMRRVVHDLDIRFASAGAPLAQGS